MSRSVTIEDLYQFKFLSRPRISPDGQRVAFVVTTIDEPKHEYRSSIWVVPSAGGEGETSGKDDKEQKKQGKGKPQVWLIPTDGGEARQLTFMQHGASNPVWSPDSKQLLFNAAVGPADQETDDGKPLPKARVIDRLWYRLDGVGFIYERRQHLFLLDVAGGEPQQLTDGDWDDSDAAWSPDGTHIAFASSRAEDRWRIPCPDLYTLTIEDGKAANLQCLTDGSISCSSPSWSPDGQTLAFLAALKLRSGNHIDLYTVPANAVNAQAACLTSDFEGTCMDWTNSDMGDDHLMPPPAWSSDGKTLYILASQRGASRVYAVPTSGAGKQPPALTPGDVHVRDFTADLSSGKLSLLVASSTSAPEIFI